MKETQDSVTLTPCAAGRFFASDFLPLIIESNDILHNTFGKSLLQRSDITEEDIRRYVRDFRTIRLSMGQRMGHTHAVIALAKPGDLVVGLDDRMTLWVASDTGAGIEFMTRNMLMSEIEWGLSPKGHPTIWLMDFSRWPRTSLNAIRERLIKNGDQRMIILG